MNIETLNTAVSDLFHLLARGLSYDAAADLVCAQHDIGAAERTELYGQYELRIKTDAELQYVRETLERTVSNVGRELPLAIASLRQLSGEIERRAAALATVREDIRRSALRNAQMAATFGGAR